MCPAPSLITGPLRRQVHLIIELEEYYQSPAFRAVVEPRHWSRLERRLDIGLHRVLHLLEEAGVRATFFASGWAADVAPELVAEIAHRGHEVASRGYGHWSPAMGPGAAFRDDLMRAHDLLKQATGVAPRGYRAFGSVPWRDRTALLEALSASGYAYDSSFRGPWLPPRLPDHSAGRTVQGVCQHPVWPGEIRHMPPWALQRALETGWGVSTTLPVLRIATWELDPDQPRLSVAPLLARRRQYRRLDVMEELLNQLLRLFAVAPLGGGPVAATESADHAAAHPAARLPRPGGPKPEAQRAPVTVVVPCFNEEPVIPYLGNALSEVARSLAARFALTFILVNDGSRDETAQALEKAFGAREDCLIIHHDSNRGLAATILTGIRAAATETVCSIDCDCTYDPQELEAMIPLLTDGVALVTASPYHPLGSVHNVSAWRLALSRSASFLYRLVLRQRLHTYTACFRVYRRSAVLDLDLREPGFLGLVELVGKLDLAGRRVIEHPATLNARLLGRSKMGVARAVCGHLLLMARLGLLRTLSAAEVRRNGTRPPDAQIPH